MLRQLFDKLETFEIKPNAQELAELLWLANYLPVAPPPVRPKDESRIGNPSNPPKPKETKPPVEKPDKPPPLPPEKVDNNLPQPLPLPPKVNVQTETGERKKIGGGV